MNIVLHTIIFLMMSCSLLAQDQTLSYTLSAAQGLEYDVKQETHSSRIPFLLDGGLILIEGKLEDEYATFILDTGAPTLLINQIPQRPSDAMEVVSINGKSSIASIDIDAITFGNTNLAVGNAYQLDLSHIEETLGRPIGGVLGYDLIKGKELYVDYSKKEIRFLGERKKVALLSKGKHQQIPFQFAEHFPIIKIKIGNKKYNFVIDTGASINLVDKQLFSTIRKRNYKATSDKKLNGANENSLSAQTFYFHTIKTKLGKSAQEMTVVDLSSFNSDGDIPIHGILGYAFLKDYIFSIDYLGEQIYFWE